MIEVRDGELARRMAAYIDQIRAKHPKATAPADAEKFAATPAKR